MCCPNVRLTMKKVTLQQFTQSICSNLVGEYDDELKSGCLPSHIPLSPCTIAIGQCKVGALDHAFSGTKTAPQCSASDAFLFFFRSEVTSGDHQKSINCCFSLYSKYVFRCFYFVEILMEFSFNCRHVCRHSPSANICQFFRDLAFSAYV